MPIYEYECTSCGHRLESIQKISDEPLKICPSCQAPKLKKLISAAAFRLKGGGWYETDFKGNKKKNVADSGGSDAKEKKDSKSSESGSGKSETKAASTDKK
jgi:putative FmdB family regulatory protein